MAKVTTLFWDVGGVILTNGWDGGSRKLAAAQFNLDWEDFEDRHDLCFPAFENGQATLDQYLDRTIFYRPRALDRKSTRLNSSHGSISYAVCCLKNNKSSHSRFRPLRQPDL